MAKKQAKSDLLQLSVTLFCITLTVALVLAVVNGFTKDKIAEITAQKSAAACAVALPQATTFESVAFDAATYTDPNGVEILEVSRGSDAEGEAGYVIRVGAKGYSSTIDMMVGFAVDGTLVKTSIISMSDTPGLGSKVQSEASFAAQVEGTDTLITGVKKGAAAEGEIDVISGATISSKGFINGVNAARHVFDLVTKGAAK